MKPLIDAEELARFLPKLSEATAETFAPLLDSAMREFEIVSKKRRCAFLSNLAHESSGLKRWHENLNYSASRLMDVFGSKYFPTIESAIEYANKPVAIANRVYANRLGNGNEDSGDGWNYRGRGPIQLTGKVNYLAFSHVLRLDLVKNPDLAAELEHGFRIAAAFWKEKGLNELADSLTMLGDAAERYVLTQICKRINGGTNGLSDRLNYFRLAKQVLHGDGVDPVSDLPPTVAPVEPARPADPPEESLIETVITSPTAKPFWPRIGKHVLAGITWLIALYEAHNYWGALIFGVIAVGIAWAVYHNRKRLKSAFLKLLK